MYMWSYTSPANTGFFIGEKMARTLIEVQEEYTAARSAYLNALNSKSYEISGGGMARSKANHDIESLKAQVDKLATEMDTFAGGIKFRGLIPR